jgi:DNA-binding MarR family transcriptional regulator
MHKRELERQLPASIQTMMAHLDALDPVIHQPTRFRLLAFLAQQPEAVSYQTVTERLHLRYTTLGMQIKHLEAAGLVEIERRLLSRFATVWVVLTPKGREALSRHLTHLLSALELSLPREEVR